jgi:hypothetical protein
METFPNPRVSVRFVRLLFWCSVFCSVMLPLTGLPALAVEEGPALTPSHKAKIIMAGLSLSRGLPGAAPSQALMLLAGSCETAEALESLDGKKINGVPVVYKRIGAPDLLKSIQEERPAAVFYCSESKKRTGEVAALAEKYKVVTIAENVEELTGGLMLGVEVRGERAGLVLNMPQAKAIGLEFDPRFYVVTRVIQ